MRLLSLKLSITMLWLFAAINLQGQSPPEPDKIRVGVIWEGPTVPLEALADTGFVNSSITNALNSVVHPPTDLSLNGTVLESSTGANADLTTILGSADNIYTSDGSITGVRTIDLVNNASKLRIEGYEFATFVGSPILTMDPTISGGSQSQFIFKNGNGQEMAMLYNNLGLYWDISSFMLLRNRLDGNKSAHFIGNDGLRLFYKNDGLEGARWQSSTGRLGIGTVSPQRVLHTVGQIRLGDYGDETFSASGTHAVLLAADEADGDIVDDTNVYLKSGNVGIGFSNPSGLTVSQDVTDTPLGVDNIRIGNRFGTPRLLFEDDASSVIHAVDNFNGMFRFFRPGLVSMVISGSGNIGIGTTAPTEKLEVNGNVKGTAFIGDGSQLTNLPVTSSMHDISIIALEGNDFNHFETGMEHDGLTCTDITAEGLDGTSTTVIKYNGVAIHTIPSLADGAEYTWSGTGVLLNRGDDLTFEATGGTASITISCN